VSVENFVPFLDFKERAQQWQWIGAGRDGDAALHPLYQFWLRMETAGDASTREGTATPPPRM
jgi:hypothetical protein